MTTLCMGDQASYKASALAVRARNFSLLSSYQTELLVDMGEQREKGMCALWKEIVTINGLVLVNARQENCNCGLISLIVKSGASLECRLSLATLSLVLPSL